MNKKLRAILPIGTGLALIAAGAVMMIKAPVQHFDRTFFAMDCPCEITVYSKDDCTKAIYDRITELDGMLSAYDEGSEINRLNSAGRLVGVVGMNEIIENGWKAGERSLVPNDAKTQIPVQSVAVTAVITVDWEDDMHVAADIMAEKHISTLPVLDKDEMVGILTEYDIIEMISACRERDQLYVQISGLEEEDKIYAEAMYEDIGNEMSKVSKIHKPESLSIHVTRYNESGDKKKYSLIGKLFISGRTYNSKAVGWDLVQTNKDLVQALGSQVKDEKDSHVSRRRKTKS